jgi:trehalose synthase
MDGPRLADYGAIAGEERIAVLWRLARRLEGLRVVMVDSTRVGGGVAEILVRRIPMLRELGIDARWEIIEGAPEFYDVTKSVHNALQGARLELRDAQREIYLVTNRRNAGRLDLGADLVVIHDPQPAGMIDFVEKRCPWIWRCQIDAARPNRTYWRFLRGFVDGYDASLFSMASFA